MLGLCTISPLLLLKLFEELGERPALRFASTSTSFSSISKGEIRAVGTHIGFILDRVEDSELFIGLEELVALFKLLIFPAVVHIKKFYEALSIKESIAFEVELKTESKLQSETCGVRMSGGVEVVNKDRKLTLHSSYWLTNNSTNHHILFEPLPSPFLSLTIRKFYALFAAAPVVKAPVPMKPHTA